jgi:hypothetical protein
MRRAAADWPFQPPVSNSYGEANSSDAEIPTDGIDAASSVLNPSLTKPFDIQS